MCLTVHKNIRYFGKFTKSLFVCQNYKKRHRSFVVLMGYTLMFGFVLGVLRVFFTTVNSVDPKVISSSELIPEYYGAGVTNQNTNRQLNWRFAQSAYKKENTPDVSHPLAKYSSKNSLNKCNFVKIVMPNDAKDEFRFQHVPKTKIYVYSAILDLRKSSNRSVRITGISPKDPGEFYCQFYYTDGAVFSVLGNTTNVLTKKQKMLHAPFNYTSQIFICKEPRKRMPSAVAIAKNKCTDDPRNILKIHARGNVREEKVPKNILTCIKLLYNFKSPHKLIEFFEYQKLIKIDHVIVYDVEAPSSDVDKVLSYYRKTGFLTVQPWKLPMKSTLLVQQGGSLRGHGQHAQIHDCVYRNMDQYKYIFIQDTDEFIISNIPQVRTTWEMLSRLKNIPNSNNILPASYLFPNAYFCVTAKEMIFDISWLLLRKKLFRNKIHSTERSKSLINPRRVQSMGVHVVTEPYKGFSRFERVPPSIALMHHYRYVKTADKKCNILDNTTLKYTNNLYQSVNHVCASLGLSTISK